jgi:Homeodomain-like domain
MHKKYIVRLSDAERQWCEKVAQELKGESQKGRRAKILLKADVDGSAWTDEKTSEALGCRVQTVENVRRRFVLEGLEATLEAKTRETPPTPPILDGKAEAKVIAMRLGKPPAGYGRWTLRLLAERVVELEIVESISYESIRRTLKKTG